MTQTLTACRTAGCTAPPTADHATLHRTGDAELLRAFASLTHSIHAAPEKRLDDLRAQRDMVEAEVLRRMGGQA